MQNIHLCIILKVLQINEREIITSCVFLGIYSPTQSLSNFEKDSVGLLIQFQEFTA